MKKLSQEDDLTLLKEYSMMYKPKMSFTDFLVMIFFSILFAVLFILNTIIFALWLVLFVFIIYNDIKREFKYDKLIKKELERRGLI